MSSKANYLIIGNSAAAIGCIEGVRQKDKVGGITVISDEKHHTYSRPLISYLLYGKTDEQRMKYRDDSFYKDNNVKTMLGKKVIEINPDKKVVILDDGKEVGYDKLLVSTGSRPVIPPIEGIDSVEKKFTFMTLDESKALDKAIDENSRVLIMGAGLIGLKCAEGISGKVKSVQVVDLADRILPSIMDEHGAKLVQKHIEKQGISFTLGDSVTAFDKNTAILKSGKRLDFDVLVIAVGVRPNTELVLNAGGKVNKGIVIDEKCKTTLTDIYAAGDCTESIDITTGEQKILALLPNAYVQGECAGIVMAGGQSVFDKAIPMNAIGFFGLHTITAGTYEGEEYIEKSKNSYKRLITKDDLLKGYIMIGDVSRAGIYTSLIKNQKKLTSIDFNLIKEKPQLIAFSKRDRANVLAKEI